MKTLATMLLLSCCAFGQDKAAIAAAESACGPRNSQIEVTVDASQHSTPAPEAGKALIYVVQEDNIRSRFGVDGKWVGASNGLTYFLVPIDPGEHHLCAMSRLGMSTQVSLHALKAVAGETYYIVPHRVGNGEYDTQFALSEADPDEGKDLVARAKYSTSHPK
ncbi:MAG TPA: hypothetical protein VL523_01820 [Terriglobia bacterium]|nr:hypothetical protein [Terriglobia bacterium]